MSGSEPESIPRPLQGPGVELAALDVQPPSYTNDVDPPQLGCTKHAAGLSFANRHAEPIPREGQACVHDITARHASSLRSLLSRSGPMDVNKGSGYMRGRR